MGLKGGMVKGVGRIVMMGGGLVGVSDEGVLDDFFGSKEVFGNEVSHRGGDGGEMKLFVIFIIINLI